MIYDKYLLKIEGKDVKRFIRTLIKNKIELLEIRNYSTYCEVLVLKKDYKKIKEIKTIYEITLIKEYGISYLKKLIINNKIFCISLMIGLAFLYLLSNIIFDVEIVHDNKEIREILKVELDYYHIRKYDFVVSFNKKEKIVENILNKHKNKLEWLEIEKIGTKYIVKVEERKINNNENKTIYGDIVAKKNGIIVQVESTSGEVITSKGRYVKKGDILISGTIKKKDEIKQIVEAKGTVKAEVWYKVQIELPRYYHEELLTDKSTKALSINFFNKRLDVSFNKYKNKKYYDKIIFKNKLIPISLNYSIIKEMEVIDKTYILDEALNAARELGITKLKQNLGENIKVLYQKDLKIVEEESKIVLDIFYKVEEEIGIFQNIIEETN